ncbi:MAG: hypothetical protein HYW65_00725 [Candidatus Liptonbacteria bacterium]|nr:hypothetical protein [Candidatus Liptonbacteria bacterium]
MPQQGMSGREKILLAAGLAAVVAVVVLMAGPARAPQAPVKEEPAPVVAAVVPRPGLTPAQELTLQALEAAAGIGVHAPTVTAAQGSVLRTLEARAGIGER